MNLKSNLFQIGVAALLLAAIVLGILFVVAGPPVAGPLLIWILLLSGFVLVFGTQWFWRYAPILAFLCLGLAARAQTVTSDPVPGYAIASTNPPAAPTLYYPGTLGSNGLFQAGAQIVFGAWNQLSGASWTNGVNVSPFALDHQHMWGGGVGVSTAYTNALNPGFSLATVQEEETETINGQTITRKQWAFYDATLSIGYNGTKVLPYVGTVGYDVETGGALNLKHIQSGIWNQSFFTLKKTWSVNNNIKLSAFAGMGYMQAWNSGFGLYGFQLTDLMKGSGFLGLF